MLNRRVIVTVTAICVALAFLIIAVYSVSKSTDERQEIMVGSALFRVVIADSIAEQIRGLSGVESLDTDEGMLFVFPDMAPRQFWMKDMRFPLDVLWIADNTVVEISHKIPIPTGLDIPRMSTEIPVNRVLEIPAGTAARLGISVGDRVR